LEQRYPPAELKKFARALLREAGLAPAPARMVAEVLVEGDLLGKTTHGLNLLPAYLREIEAGKMTRSGEPKILRRMAATLLLDANYRAGPFVLRRALEWAMHRARKHGVATVSIRRCHHIASLIAYLPPVTQRNLLVILMCSDPANRAVAAPGGVEAVFSPNPVGVGIPTLGDPILIDTTTSSTGNGVATRLRNEGRKFSSPVLQTAHGQPTNDPRVLVANAPGTILSLGGPAQAHKGFALATLVEALTNALTGQGRAEQPERWGATVFLQIIDPKFFGGRAAFAREAQFFAQTCRQSKSKRGGPPVRMPGDQAQALRRDQLARGVALHPGILPALRPWAEKFGVRLPETCP
jgi:LDH2 family malate/lactate/ureidoglycolate dehydrogenase